ncbi:insulinase family protein [Amycolatopsis acidiphila]|uniref:Insulinase family protein n=1 Tax=Amycolatopsis acidiphila TaxID=715473 RepID=A0A558A189_9PSEU|nr:pitrilysin family protein [Amycolatopsis acidiphila]TVT18022.1 insulinase family protein [Amycolatopsis acidiphila]UIJ61025.1 insulinase family protein [Amycolatopsis acidiphila]GHG88935.1 peptidase M16 [Amycolatopsis acidiphila]
MSTATHRDAAEIGRTAKGPRAVPLLGDQRAAGNLSSVDTTIGNGLRVLAVRKANVPLVELRLRIPFAGADPLHPAMAEVLAETILTGTARRDRIEIDTELALIGGEVNATVDPERLSVNGSALADGLPTLLDVLADVLTSASYVDNEVGRESARLVERLAVSRTQPRVIAREALLKHVYGDHPVTREMPEAEDVAKVTPDAVRALHARAVLPRGSVLVVVGDIVPESVVSDIEKALQGWQADAEAAVLPPLPAVTGRDVLLVPRAGAVQSQIRLIAQALPRTDPRYAALQLANLAYGGYFSSRLVENIREDKGYTYSAHSGFEFTGATATVGVDADTANDVSAAAVLETFYELGKLALVPPTEEEVESVRQYAVGSLLTSTASQAGLASQLSALAAGGLGAEWLAEHPARLAAVTVEEVAQAALDYFAPVRFTGVVVGDAESLAPRLAALGGFTVGEPAQS